MEKTRENEEKRDIHTERQVNIAKWSKNRIKMWWLPEAGRVWGKREGEVD